jgi:hypothetical protein
MARSYRAVGGAGHARDFGCVQEQAAETMIKASRCLYTASRWVGFLAHLLAG